MKAEAILGLAVLTIPIILYFTLPIPENAKIPVHWNASLTANQQVSKPEFIWYILGTIAAYVFLVIAPVIMPRRKHTESIKRAYGLLLVAFSIGFAAVLSAAELYAAGYIGNPDQIVRVAISTILIVSGAVTTISRSNWIIGIRTAWGLENEHAWTVSNRIGGLGIMIGGIIFMLGLNPYYALAVILGASTAAIAAAYAVWRRENAH